jgi:hypothetical protein
MIYYIYYTYCIYIYYTYCIYIYIVLYIIYDMYIDIYIYINIIYIKVLLMSKFRSGKPTFHRCFPQETTDLHRFSVSLGITQRGMP